MKEAIGILFFEQSMNFYDFTMFAAQLAQKSLYIVPEINKKSISIMVILPPKVGTIFSKMAMILKDKKNNFL